MYALQSSEFERITHLDFREFILPWTLTTELVHRNFHSICIDYSVLLVFRCGLGLELGLGQVMSPRPE